jgi:uncharacterized protein
MKLEGLLQRVTSLIVSACDPEKIVLFGSYAKGQQNTDSDLDILVIGDFHEAPLLRDRELRGLLYQIPVRIDLHVVTPQEVATQLTKPFGFMNSVLSSGVILYSKSNVRES